jgi:hypothetical protein
MTFHFKLIQFPLHNTCLINNLPQVKRMLFKIWVLITRQVSWYGLTIPRSKKSTGPRDYWKQVSSITTTTHACMHIITYLCDAKAVNCVERNHVKIKEQILGAHTG